MSEQTFMAYMDEIQAMPNWEAVLALLADHGGRVKWTLADGEVECAFCERAADLKTSYLPAGQLCAQCYERWRRELEET